MIKSIFYSRFHPEKGPTILHQVPAGLISISNAPLGSIKREESHSASKQQRVSSRSPSPSKASLPQQDGDAEQSESNTKLPTAATILFPFSAISDYLIPRQEYRDNCITVCINGYRVIGYPVSIYGKQYARNEFIFNVALVVDDEAEMVVWTGIARRIAALLKEMEEVGGSLSEDENEAAAEVLANDKSAKTTQERPASKIHALCEMILEDLNNYCECMIPLDSANTLNLKLFPLYPPAPRIADYHVPLLTVDLSTLADSTWDLTMQRISPHINGVNSVAKIASLAESDSRLVRKAITHLVYYGCCLLLDVFSFAASYAITPAFGDFVADEEMQDECARYVSVAVAVNVESSAATTDMNADERKSLDEPDFAILQESAKDLEISEIGRDDVVRLYATLRQGVSLRVWCLERKEALVGVDVRRLISFGLIRGFLYRVHKYAIGTSSSRAKEKRATNRDKIEITRQRRNHQTSPRNNSISTATSNGNLRDNDLEEDLSRYLNGLHCFDEICSDLQLPDKSVISALKTRGDAQVIQR